MSNRSKTTLARLTAAVASVAALAFLATVAAPAIYAQEQPAPKTPGGTERTEEITEQATDRSDATPGVEGEGVTKAVAVLSPASGSNVRGVVTFTKVEDGVRVVAHLEGLTPGQHGFHVHEFGDCSGADASTAGAHFNPTGKPHAGPDDSDRHEGDLGNVEANEQGVAHYDRVDKEIELVGDRSIIGRSVLVHGNPDDLKSQPAGNAGPRLACGAIGIVKP